jgi:hypothetical protein
MVPTRKPLFLSAGTSFSIIVVLPASEYPVIAMIGIIIVWRDFYMLLKDPEQHQRKNQGGVAGRVSVYLPVQI